MILERGNAYWSTGISLRWTERGGPSSGKSFSGWSGCLDFLDDGFVDDDTDAGLISTEGKLHTRYAVGDGKHTDGLTTVINTLITDAAKLGIEFIGAGREGSPALYYEGDGEAADYPPPAGYRMLLRAQAERIGWATYGYEPTVGGAE